MTVSNRTSTPVPSDHLLARIRSLDLHANVISPAGLEVHSSGMFHEVQSGETLANIARQYNGEFGLSVTSASLKSANSAALRDGLQAGELLTVPGLEHVVDTAVLRQHPRLREIDGALRHVAKGGETLDQIAASYRNTTGIKVTADDILWANRETIPSSGAMPRGIALRIPGVTSAAPRFTDRSLAALDGKTLLTLVSQLHTDSSTAVSSSDTLRYRADAKHAQVLSQSASVKDAIALAESSLENNETTTRTVAVVQTKNGRYAAVPMRASETGNGDDSTVTTSLGVRADAREVIAVVQKSTDGIVTTRRFDR